MAHLADNPASTHVRVVDPALPRHRAGVDAAHHGVRPTAGHDIARPNSVRGEAAVESHQQTLTALGLGGEYFVHLRCI